MAHAGAGGGRRGKGGAPSMVQQLKMRKLRESLVSTAARLDTRATFELAPVEKHQGKSLKARMEEESRAKRASEHASRLALAKPKSAPATAKEEVARKERDMEERKQTLGGMGNLGLRGIRFLTPELKELAASLDDAQVKDMSKRLRTRVDTISQRLRDKYSKRRYVADYHAVFDKTINKRRVAAMHHVDIQRQLRPGDVQYEILSEMLEERKFRESMRDQFGNLEGKLNTIFQGTALQKVTRGGKASAAEERERKKLAQRFTKSFAKGWGRKAKEKVAERVASSKSLLSAMGRDARNVMAEDGTAKHQVGGSAVAALIKGNKSTPAASAGSGAQSGARSGSTAGPGGRGAAAGGTKRPKTLLRKSQPVLHANTAEAKAAELAITQGWAKTRGILPPDAVKPMDLTKAGEKGLKGAAAASVRATYAGPAPEPELEALLVASPRTLAGLAAASGSHGASGSGGTDDGDATPGAAAAGPGGVAARVAAAASSAGEAVGRHSVNTAQLARMLAEKDTRSLAERQDELKSLQQFKQSRLRQASPRTQERAAIRRVLKKSLRATDVALPPGMSRETFDARRLASAGLPLPDSLRTRALGGRVDVRLRTDQPMRPVEMPVHQFKKPATDTGLKELRGVGSMRAMSPMRAGASLTRTGTMGSITTRATSAPVVGSRRNLNIAMHAGGAGEDGRRVSDAGEEEDPFPPGYDPELAEDEPFAKGATDPFLSKPVGMEEAKQAGSNARQRSSGRIAGPGEGIIDEDLMERLDKLWLKLEVPATNRFDFMCKYSHPSHAANMSDSVNVWEEAVNCVLCREGVLRLYIAWERQSRAHTGSVSGASGASGDGDARGDVGGTGAAPAAGGGDSEAGGGGGGSDMWGPDDDSVQGDDEEEYGDFLRTRLSAEQLAYMAKTGSYVDLRAAPERTVQSQLKEVLLRLNKRVGIEAQNLLDKCDDVLTYRGNEYAQVVERAPFGRAMFGSTNKMMDHFSKVLEGEVRV